MSKCLVVPVFALLAGLTLSPVLGAQTTPPRNIMFVGAQDNVQLVLGNWDFLGFIFIGQHLLNPELAGRITHEC